MKLLLASIAPLIQLLSIKLAELQKAKQLMSDTLKLHLTDVMASELDYLHLRILQQTRASRYIKN